MSTTFQRRPVTDYMLEHLRTAMTFGGVTYKVGDSVIPEGAGWGVAQPNKPGAKFTPYSVLTVLGTTPAPNSGSVVSPQEDWHVQYMIQSFGINRTGAEGLSDRVRKALNDLSVARAIIDCHTVDVPAPNNYRVQDIWHQSIGAVNVSPGVDPPMYGEADQFTIWLGKRLT